MTTLPTFSGYASVFGVLDRDRDIVERGAFRRTLAENSAYALLWQHRQDEPIGRITRLHEDAHGLWMEAELCLGVDRAREAHALLKSAAISGLSIGYVTRDYTLDERTGHRRITDLDLWEISLVTFPANPQAVVREVKRAVRPDASRPAHHPR